MTFLIFFLENAAYIAAITFQLAAAILLVGNTDVRPDKIIKAYCDRKKAVAFNEDGTLLDRSGLEETVNAAWTNRIAFSYLFAGYLIGVLGECTMDRWIALLIIGLLTCVLFIGTFKFAKNKAASFPTITDKDIPREKGVTIMKPINTQNK